MKNIKLMIIALVALLGFNSCSDKFNFNDEKKLVRYTCVNDTNLVFIDRSFEYDAKGHLVSAYEEQNFAEDVYSRGSYTYTWHKKGVDVHGEHAIKLLGDTEENNTTEDFTIKFENKRFAKFIYNNVEYKDYNYTYDSKGRLMHYRASVSDITCEWEGDKLVSALNIDIHGDHKYKYGNISCVKGYCPIIVWNNTQEVITLAHPERVGLITTHCPVSVDYYSEFFDEPVSYCYVYEYEFDDEGYITKIKETQKDKNNKDEIMGVRIFTLTWE